MRTMLSALVVVGLALLPQVGIAGEKPETAKANVYKVGVKGMT